ncbi:hypothetical protein ABPG77_006667 [Micractinium sp. CCAP 211/92]
MELQGSCRCGAVRFSCRSHTPVPYQRCYCTICRKLGGSGYSINLCAQADSLKVDGRENLHTYRVMLPGESGGALQPTTNARFFCKECGCYLWAQDPTWPQWIYPSASAIDSELPRPPHSVHLMLGSKASWVEPQVGPEDETYDEYPELSIEDWHRKHGLYVE